MTEIIAIITALAPLVVKGFELIKAAAAGEAVDKAKILAELQEAAAKLQETLSDMANQLAINDAKIDEMIKKKG